jgi:glutamate N-acetyltransferase / amino-acid N-acetyltransferase
VAKKHKEKAKAWKARAKDLAAELDMLSASLAAAPVAAAAPAEPVKAKKPAKLVSPLAPKGGFPALPVIGGVSFASAAAGVRYAGRTDVTLVRLAPGTTIAGTFTRSATRSAAVLDCEDKIGRDDLTGAGAAILVNSGNSNAFIGAAGAEAVAAISAATAEAAGVPSGRVFTSSTGVIGEPLPWDRITAALGGLTSGLSETGIEGAARAIMTTDTFPKGAAAEVQTAGGTIRIAGIAKGSGMIAPDMATMLVYIFTDAAIARPLLQAMVSRQTERTFNRITVDGDTSTSDTLIACATGAAEASPITDPRSREARAFERALGKVMLDLSHQVIRDGEGATKFVEVRVSGAKGMNDARRVAFSIANSPLVKTAIAGQDPNWGRVVAAVGKSGARADRDRLSIRFGKILVAENGQRAASYDEATAAAYMRGQDLLIAVDLGMGRSKCSVWTCDLTHRYIDINADYRS